jgi:hypothetical protein
MFNTFTMPVRENRLSISDILCTVAEFILKTFENLPGVSAALNVLKRQFIIFY